MPEGARSSRRRKAPEKARTFRTADVARVLNVSAVHVRSMVRAGLCRPSRHGRAFDFSFQDLVLLRAAHGLHRAGVPAKRVKQALHELSRQLPAERPLSGLRIYADGRRVTVREGQRAWQPDSGQQVFVFDLDELAERSRIVVAGRRSAEPKRTGKRGAESAVEWFERGLSLEGSDPRAARSAYLRALELDPDYSDAHVNLGRLLHELGDVKAALQHYEHALERGGPDAIAHYNMALAFEDADDTSAALRHYHLALDLDAAFADAHFNLGRLLERLGRRDQALRHFLAYRRLT
jgi:tetratricopeptide (TPR) repeat protein